MFGKKLKILLEEFSVYNVIEEMAEHGPHSVPCFDTNEIIDLLP